jgi:hypothetical protein
MLDVFDIIAFAVFGILLVFRPIAMGRPGRSR